MPSLKVQAERMLKPRLALGRSRNASKQRDNSSSSINSVRSFNQATQSIAFAANIMGVSRLKHITYQHAVVYLLQRYRASHLADKTIASDRQALEKLLGRRLPRTHDLHKLSQAPTVTDKWLSENVRQGRGFLKETADTVDRLMHTLGIYKSIESYSNADNFIATPKRDIHVKTSTRPGETRPLSEISRAYTDEQVKAIALSFKQERSRLAVLIARDAGLRAHELGTIRPVTEGQGVTAQRDWRSDRHVFRGDSVTYLVTGKGGLVRSVKLSRALSERLEARRLATPERAVDRNTKFTRYYDLRYGNSFSHGFTEASKKVLGFSLGAHGTRHAFAQDRVLQCVSKGYSLVNAKHVVSQELGHMRMTITNEYLR
jgi:integrase